MLKSIKNIIALLRYRKHVHVYALVGKAGTGKSFRAKLIAEKYGIDFIIDDGLLIRGHMILAGKSAKREKNKFSAIKRAIFEDFRDAKIVKEVLKKEKVTTILVIGTSEKMVAKISERLGLPYPDQVIYIEDVATKEEMSTAKEIRRVQGKHVIPVPMLEVKKDSAHRILDSVKLFIKSHPIFFWKKTIIEKTIVQPPFYHQGRLSISEKVLVQMIMHCVQEFSKNIDIEKIVIDSSSPRYKIDVLLIFSFRENLAVQLSELQNYIREHIEKYSGIHIEELNLTVESLQ